MLAVGDVSGDGYPDLVLGSQDASGAALVWYEFPNWERHDVATGQYTTDGKVADLDADGDLDIVVGDLERGLVWFENLGRGGSWRLHEIAAGYVHDLAVADLNGDGMLDLARTDKKNLEAWYRQKDGSFRGELVSSEPGEGLDVADLDGDGVLDLLYSNHWLAGTHGPNGMSWERRELAPGWPVETRIRSGDVDGDGRLDVVMSVSEGEGRVSWFSTQGGNDRGDWLEHPISNHSLAGTHSLAVADFDLDGQVDVLAAEMHTSEKRRIVLFRQAAQGWEEVVLAMHGSHNMAVGDVDLDGDVDVVGKNYAGPARFLELWENRAADRKLVPVAPASGEASTGWHYAPIDTDRPATDRHTFGMRVADVDLDGRPDVLAGGSLYLQPGERAAQGPWPRQSLGLAVDVIDVTPQIHNGWRTILALDRQWLYLFSRLSDDAGWQVRRLQTLPEGRTQGAAAGPVEDDGSYELFFTRGSRLYSLRVPPDVSGSFVLQLISTDVDEAGVAAADLDGDGDTDLVTVAGGARRLLWLEKQAGVRYVAHPLGGTFRWFDRVAVGDINGDGRLDIAYSEESQDSEYNAGVGWLEAPTDPRAGYWKQNRVAVFRSANSLDLADVDGDQRLDLAVGEHTDLRPGQVAPDTFTGILLNRGPDAWEVEVVEVGDKSSHLGAKVASLVAGELDILSIGWEQSCCVHRWRRMDGLSDAATGQAGANE